MEVEQLILHLVAFCDESGDGLLEFDNLAGTVAKLGLQGRELVLDIDLAADGDLEAEWRELAEVALAKNS